MPLPNFYPPLFYWLAAVLHHAGLPFLLAFKLVSSVPFLLIPAALGLLSWCLTSRNTLVASCTALAACVPLLDLRLESNFPCGLDYSSTFSEGLYTQPLGFILLVTCVAVHLSTISTWSRFAIASLLLALVVLASFFSAVATVPFVCVGLVRDLQDADNTGVQIALPSMRLPAAIFTPAYAFLLSAFWTVPLLRDYSLFVTRPLQVSAQDVIPHGPWIWVWYGAALAGVALVLARGSARMRAFTAGCGGLLILILLSFLSVVHWIPSQPPRLISSFNFLLAVPVGWLLAMLLCWASKFACRCEDKRRLVVAGAVALASLALFGRISVAPLDKAGDAIYFGEPSIAGVLHFAQQHADGRYIVESPWQREDQYDARAFSAYLGMQGNESLSVVFREASPGSVFFNPVVNALSASGDSFGISAALADDLDFYNQPPERHLARARGIGVRYIACLTPWIKRRFRQQPDLIEHPLGRWSVFEMKAVVAPEAEALHYLPALVVSPIALKRRRNGAYSFTRLAEEQFNSGHNDVLLAHAETEEIDKLDGLENFSTLILDTYRCKDQSAAYEKLRRFAQERLLILLPSSEPLYGHLEERLSEFPHAVIIARQIEEQADWFGETRPWLALDESSLRKEWRLIEKAIENSKIPVRTDGPQVVLSHTNSSFSVQMAHTTGGKVPVLVRTTFHPGWVRADGLRIYPATPFFMLTFANGPFEAKFQRDGIERAAIVVSGFMFCGLALTLLFACRQVA